MAIFLPKFDNTSCFLEILADKSEIVKNENGDVTVTNTNDYIVEFVDQNTDTVQFSKLVNVNHWVKYDGKDKNWKIRVTSNDQLVYERKMDQIFNKVFIRFDSASLGDSISWIPYIEEYRKKHKVEVLVSTYWNNLFDKVYPNLKFLPPETDPFSINDVDKRFLLNYWPIHLHNKDRFNNVAVADYRNLPLQLIAPLYLGLPLIEMQPKVNIPTSNRKIQGKYVVIGFQSTAQCKYWNNPFGWERVFDFLSRNGYKIVLIDKFKSFGTFGNYNQAPKNKSVIDKTGNYPISERITDIKYADMFIGLSSGLAWLAWAVGTPVVMISGFTKPWNEFVQGNYRVHNNSVCNGCWNDDTQIFDATNWMYCPLKSKDAPDKFICSKSIEAKDVVASIKEVIEDNAVYGKEHDRIYGTE